MKKNEIQKNLKNLSLMSRFVRQKRGLSQSDVAKLADISQATVGFLETCNAQKISVRNIKYIFSQLSLNHATLNDPSLYDFLLKKEKIYNIVESRYAERTLPIIETISSVFDAYAALLGWQYIIPIADKSDFIKMKRAELCDLPDQNLLADYILTGNFRYPNYLPSFVLYDILKSLPQKFIEDILFVDDFTIEAPDEDFAEDLFDYVLTQDPFLKFMKHIEIPFFDHFDIIKKSISTLTTLKSASFTHIESRLLQVISEIQTIVKGKYTKPDMLVQYIEGIGATYDEIDAAIKILRLDNK